VNTICTPWPCDETATRRKLVEAHRPLPANRIPGSTQIALLGLESASDSEIWQYAKDHGFVIVSRDSDFQERSLVSGHPPQVIWLTQQSEIKATKMEAQMWEPGLPGDGKLANRPINRAPTTVSWLG
jgi:hypothetical protein